MSRITTPSKLSWCRWSAARSIANSRLPQLSALLPAIGYAWLWSDHFHDWLDSRKLLVESFLPLSIRLQMLWWGAMLMTVGWLIYVWRCPNEIRRSGEPEDFVIEQLQMPSVNRFHVARQLAADHVRAIDHTESRKLLLGEFSPAEVYMASEGTSESDVFPNDYYPKRPHYLDVLFRFQYHVIDHTRPVWRLWCLICLVSGAILFLIPSIEVSLRVGLALISIVVG